MLERHAGVKGQGKVIIGKDNGRLLRSTCGRRETTRGKGEGQINGPDTAPPTVMSGTRRPID
jgi:hypothetical protein